MTALEQAGKARTLEAKGEKPHLEHIVPNTTVEIPESIATFVSGRNKLLSNFPSCVSEFHQLVHIKKHRYSSYVLLVLFYRLDLPTPASYGGWIGG